MHSEKHTKTQAQTVVSQKLGQIQSQKYRFQKVNSAFFETGLSFVHCCHVGLRQGPPLPTIPGTTVTVSSE